MLDMHLEVKDGLLATECAYPSDSDLTNLPHVWLTSNEVPWEPTILENENSITVPAEIEGSQQQTAPTMDLLSELVNSPMPVIDSTKINITFNTEEHIGMEFIRNDQHSVPTKTNVIEVNEDTGKVLLEYVHGDLELVEANIIQEALLSRSQPEVADGLWTFFKVLNHKTAENGHFEVE
eukprot:13670567-Ditylum_brightwellii.AAC.1